MLLNKFEKFEFNAIINHIDNNRLFFEKKANDIEILSTKKSRKLSSGIYILKFKLNKSFFNRIKDFINLNLIKK